MTEAHRPPAYEEASRQVAHHGLAQAWPVGQGGATKLTF